MKCSNCTYYSRKKVKGKTIKWCSYFDIHLNKVIKKFLESWCDRDGK